MAHSVRGSIMIMGSAAALTYHTRLILNHLTSLSVPKIHVSFCASCSRGLYFKGFHRSPFGRLPEKKRFFQDAPCMVNPSIKEGETCVTEKVSSPSCTLASVSEGLEKNADTIDLNPPRGTRDFLPEDMLLRNWLFEKFREVSSLFAFEEVDFPLLESEELFVRKGGEEITQQLYNFEDKGGRRVALRPELTPSLARLVMQKGKALSLPIKWFSIGQCWRYERMTRGRRREHYQWNMDIMGIPGIEAEAELLSAIITFFMKVGITVSDVGIKVSSRKVLQALLDRYSISKDSFPAVCVIVDKIEKLPAEDIRKELKAIGITPNAAEGILQDLSLKSLRDLEGLLGKENEAVLELKELFSYANYYGYSQWLHFDASVVRGLAYYTGIVFEGFDHERKLRAICGGGRYDHLLSTFGGVDVPACGFGFGDAVIMELLKEKRLVPTLCREIDDIVWPLRRELRQAAVMVASTLRNKGRNVDLILDDKRSKWAFRHAEKVNAKRMVVVGDDEWTRGAVRVKNLSTREERDIQISELS